MKNAVIKPSSFVDKLEPYKQSSHKVWEQIVNKNNNSNSILKLDWNEATDVPSFIFEKVIKNISDHKIRLNWYPDVQNRMLLRKLSKYVKLPIKNIQYFNGSDGALEYIGRAYIEPGDRIIVISPTYDNFRVYVESCGGEVLDYYNNSAFEKNIDKLIDFLNSTMPRMVYLVNPNNPTGLLYSPDEIESLVSRFKKLLFIIDEAYCEFCNVSSVKLIRKYGNLIVTRTFTKAFGLGSFRLGYVVAPEDIIANLNKIRVGKNVNSFAQIAGIVALDNSQYMKNYVQQVTKSKKFLVSKLKKLGLEVKNTPANFILLKCKKPVSAIKALERKNIFVRNRSDQPQLQNYIRITVGNIKTTSEFIKRFQKILDKNGNCFF